MEGPTGSKWVGKGGRRGSEGSVIMEERSEGGCPAVQEGEDRPQAKEGRWPPGSEKATEADSPLERAVQWEVLDFWP